MNVFIYMFYDNVSNSFIGSPYLLSSKPVALRTFKSFVVSEHFPYKPMQDDLSIYCLGSLDLNTGFLTSDKQFIVKVSSLIDEHFSQYKDKE